MRVQATLLPVPEHLAVAVATGTIYTQVVGPVGTLPLNNVKRGIDVVVVAAHNVVGVHMQERDLVAVLTVVRTTIQELERVVVRLVAPDMDLVIIQQRHQAAVRNVPPTNTGTVQAVRTVLVDNFQPPVPPVVRRVRQPVNTGTAAAV